MISTNLKRIINFATKDFSRNKGIAIAAIFVLVIMIMLVTSLFFFQNMVSHLTNQLQDKIDITAYFNETVAEQDILDLKDQLLTTNPNVKKIEYISKEQALAIFSENHQSDSILSQALQEVGTNPFLPSLNIVTNGDPDQYARIAEALQSPEFSNLIDEVDFSQKKDIIEKVYAITSNINLAGLILGIILLIIAILVVYNTIKLAIESSKEEINTMRIVGASDWFIRGPFMVQGIIYGIIAFIISFFISGICAFLISHQVEIVLPGFNTLSFFLRNWWIFVLIQLVFGVGVAGLSSFMVVKKHLKV